jgi:hypothetical protein
VHQEFGGRGVFDLECGLGGLGDPADGAAHAARRGGLATRAARAAHAGPGAAAHKMASPAVYAFSLSRIAALRSGAALAAMITANVSCRRVSQAFLKIFEPKRQRLEDSGVS